MKVPGGPHFWVSLVKSVIRIGGCAVTPFIKDRVLGFALLCACLSVAEFVGILEEIFDRRV